MGFEKFFGGFINNDESEQNKQNDGNKEQVANPDLTNIMPEKVINELPKAEEYMQNTGREVVEVPANITPAEIEEFKKPLEELANRVNQVENPEFN